MRPRILEMLGAFLAGAMSLAGCAAESDGAAPVAPPALTPTRAIDPAEWEDLTVGLGLSDEDARSYVAAMDQTADVRARLESETGACLIGVSVLTAPYGTSVYLADTCTAPAWLAPMGVVVHRNHFRADELRSIQDREWARLTAAGVTVYGSGPDLDRDAMVFSVPGSDFVLAATVLGGLWTGGATPVIGDPAVVIRPGIALEVGEQVAA